MTTPQPEAHAPDMYVRACARVLLERLDMSEAPQLVERLTANGYASPSAVLGVSRERTHSTFPAWYSESLRVGYDGSELRACLECLTRGETPNVRRREARWILERIEGARADGDPTMDLPPCEGRADGLGGGRARRRQAKGLGPVERVPIRAPADLLARARAKADAEGVTLNALLLELLASACPVDDDVPF